jgi:DNA-binding LacI/PurR family transcriptional regulator
MNESVKITAVQAINDLVAIGAANIFLNQGVKIPKQLSIVGFGNILTAEHFRVPLTTIRQPKYRLGEAAMDAMLKLLRRQRLDGRRLGGEIIVRSSTGPPPEA